MESARDRLRRMLEAGEMDESEALALLNELARRRAERKDPLMWWLQKTSWVPWAILVSLVVLISAWAASGKRGKIVAGITSFVRENPFGAAALGLSFAMGVYLILTVTIPFLAVWRARLQERRRLRG